MKCLSLRPRPVLRASHVAVLIAVGVNLPAALAEPLHPPGKRDIYERVLTRPGVSVSRAPGTNGRDPVKALSRLYVFARQSIGGKDWLRVGTGVRDRTVLGWIPADSTVPWKQQLTLVFTNRGSGREPMLFLRDWDDLRAVLDNPSPGREAAELREIVAAGRHDPRVLAIEPANFIDFGKHFYLLPILDFAEYRSTSGDKVRALKVASVTLPAPVDNRPSAASTNRTPTESADGSAYRAAVVFVVDSTISMGPYIDETKAAVARFYRQIQEAGLGDRVAFGLVAFRAASKDPARAGALEFVARTYANPADVKDGKDFLKRVASLEEARASTDRFDEDSFAGIQAALNTPDWRQRFAERHIVLITDAGALDGSQQDLATGQRQQSVTGLDAQRIRSIAGETGTSIAVLHLLTPQAQAAGNTESAQGQYRTLANNRANQETAYFPIPDGSIGAFSAAVDAYAGRLIENMRRYAATHAAETGVRRLGEASKTSPLPDAADQAARIRAIVDSLGHAAQLAYLGQVQGTRAPEIFEAWIGDKDFADPSIDTVDVRVLLTKDELSDLQQVLKGIVEAAETDLSAEDSSRSFFDRLTSVAARFSVDPQSGGIDRSTRLADLGLLGEYLQGLPYKSDVLTLTQDTWTRWGTMRQVEFIDRLTKKIRRYGLYYADSDKWVDLAQSNSSDLSDTVYPIPLTDLP